MDDGRSAIKRPFEYMEINNRAHALYDNNVVKCLYQRTFKCLHEWD